MKVFLAGATGRVATETLKALVAEGHKVIAGARQSGRIALMDGVTPVTMDLHDPVESLVEPVKGCDAVIFAAGSRGKDLLQTDAYGAVKLMQAAETVGLKRFIMLSALYSLTPEKWGDRLKDYYIAKYFADNYLVHQTDLNYTIVQPGQLLEEKGTGRISLGDEGYTSIPIADVGAVLATLVDSPAMGLKVLEIHPGTLPISEAFTKS
ncbi:SDR family oxidoreductase [Streptococcus dentasini]